MSQYTFNTRVIGPNPKGSALTLEELDNSLLFLSSSIGNPAAVSQSVSAISQSVVELTAEVLILSQSIEDLPAVSQSIVDLTEEVLILSQSISEIEIKPLSGSNYLLVEANGTPTQNALFLSASYTAIKNLTLTSTNRFSLLVAPGRYQFASDFILDTEYIDVVSLTGERDILITGSNTISITANDVYVRGIDVDTKNFTIADDLPLLKLKNCKGGDLSFGGTVNPTPGNPPITQILVNGTFINCEGGDLSFAGNGIASGIFENCIGGESSFGYDIIGGTFINCKGGDFSFGGAEGDIDGHFENCTGGEGSFTVTGIILEDTILKECTGDLYSFASNGFIEGKLYNCRLTSGSFTPNVQGNGDIVLSIDGNNNII
jgi:hypothetical protein